MLPFTSLPTRSSESPVRRRVAVCALTVALAVTAAGCSGTAELNQPSRFNSPPPPTATTAAPTTTPSADSDEEVDYSALLLTATDLSDQDDTFALRSSTSNPNGLPGASALFVNTDDTRAISDTVVLYPDAATATATLKQALSAVDSIVVGGTPQPSPVGTDGTVVRGTAPDGGKEITLLLFTQGHALARLEFQSATGDSTTDAFVTSIGKMQQIALRAGLSART
jgi:hypothetical protein